WIACELTVRHRGVIRFRAFELCAGERHSSVAVSRDRVDELILTTRYSRHRFLTRACDHRDALVRWCERLLETSGPLQQSSIEARAILRPRRCVEEIHSLLDAAVGQKMIETGEAAEDFLGEPFGRLPVR